MAVVLISWVVSLIVCAVFTFAIPAWDAHQLRKNSRGMATQEAPAGSLSGLGKRESAV